MNTSLDRISFLRKHTTHNVTKMYYGVHSNAKEPGHANFVMVIYRLKVINNFLLLWYYWWCWKGVGERCRMARKCQLFKDYIINIDWRLFSISIFILMRLTIVLKGAGVQGRMPSQIDVWVGVGLNEYK